MHRITPDIFDQITLDASLQRLDITALKERLEFSPLLVEAGLRATPPDSPLSCVCKIPDDLPDGMPDIRVSDPARDGMGTTGNTSGGESG